MWNKKILRGEKRTKEVVSKKRIGENSDNKTNKYFNFIKIIKLCRNAYSNDEIQYILVKVYLKLIIKLLETCHFQTW